MSTDFSEIFTTKAPRHKEQAPRFLFVKSCRKRIQGWREKRVTHSDFPLSLRDKDFSLYSANLNKNPGNSRSFGLTWRPGVFVVVALL